MPTKRFFTLLLILSLAAGVCAGAQVASAQRLEAGKPVEREIAGGESHKYKFTLQAGQFARVVVEQKKIDVALKVSAPDGEAID